MRIQLSRDEREYIYHMAKHVLDVTDRAVHEDRERVVKHLLEHAAACGNAEVRVKLMTFVKIVRKEDEREKPAEVAIIHSRKVKEYDEELLRAREADMSWRSASPVNPLSVTGTSKFQLDEPEPSIPVQEVFRMVTEEELHGQPGRDLGDAIRERVRGFMRRKENVPT